MVFFYFCGVLIGIKITIVYYRGWYVNLNSGKSSNPWKWNLCHTLYLKHLEGFTVQIFNSWVNYSVLCLVAQLCPTLCDPMDCTHQAPLSAGTFQARTLEWVPISYSRGSSQPRDWTQVSRTAGRFFTSWATREAQEYWSGWPIPFPEDLSDPGTELRSPALQADSLPAELAGKSFT